MSHTRPHLVILHLYGRNQADWADFVEVKGQYRSVAERCSRVDLIVPHGTTESAGAGTLQIHGIAGSPRNVLAFAISALTTIRKIHRESPIDILWSQDPFACGIIGWMASRRHRFPFVVEICNDFFDLTELGAGRIERLCKSAIATWVAKRAARIRTVSWAIREQLLRRGTPATKISVLCCPTDMRLFDFDLHTEEREQIRSENGLDSNLLVMFVGALVDRKGLDLLLDAAAALRPEFSQLRIAIVGDGPSRRGLETQAANLGLDGTVSFWGRLTHDKLPGALAAADAVVLPSRNEGLPRCLVEALAMQRPVVATKISGNDEVVQDGETGILVEPTVAGIRHGLEAILRMTPKEREQMGRLGRERVSVCYGLEEVADRMTVELIEGVRAYSPQTGQ
jgi:glycosyltransferase involved in cell wall biosynthesis